MSQSNQIKLPITNLALPESNQINLPGHDPDLLSKLSEAHLQLTARLGMPSLEVVNTAESQNSTNSLDRLLKHTGKLAVGALFASTLLLSACGETKDSCTTQYVTPSVAPVSFDTPSDGSSSFGTPSITSTPTPDNSANSSVTSTSNTFASSVPNQTPVAVQYCQDSNGDHYYSGGFYGGSHYYGGGYSGGGFSGGSS